MNKLPNLKQKHERESDERKRKISVESPESHGETGSGRIRLWHAAGAIWESHPVARTQP